MRPNATAMASRTLLNPAASPSYQTAAALTSDAQPPQLRTVNFKQVALTVTFSPASHGRNSSLESCSQVTVRRSKSAACAAASGRHLAQDYPTQLSLKRSSSGAKSRDRFSRQHCRGHGTIFTFQITCAALEETAGKLSSRGVRWGVELITQQTELSAMELLFHI